MKKFLKLPLKVLALPFIFAFALAAVLVKAVNNFVLLRDGTVNTLHPWLWNLFGNTADVEIRGDLGSHVLCCSNRINAGRDERIPAQLYSFIKFNTYGQAALQ